MSWNPVNESRYKDPSSTLYGSPYANRNQSLEPSSLGGLFKGRIEEINPKTLAFEVRRLDGGPQATFPGRLSFAYCSSSSGIIAIPVKGSLVIYYEQYENGIVYANVLTYITGNVARAGFQYNGKDVPQDPGFEVFLANGQVVGFKDQGMVPGDQAMIGRRNNKFKLFDDGSLLAKCTPFNFIQMCPIDHKVYQWAANYMLRTFGSYRGELNVITPEVVSIGAVHYSIDRHFVNPIEQTLCYQEESGFVDDITTASGGNFEDVANADQVQAAATIARTTDEVGHLTLSGYNVYKRKVFDFGGRGAQAKPPAARVEYYAEEIKSDGAYRIHVGSRLPGSPKPTGGVEVYYKPNGEWSIGSSLAKIKATTDGDLMFSVGTLAGGQLQEVSLKQIIEFMQKHVHGYILVPALGAPMIPTSTANPLDPFNAPPVGAVVVAIDGLIPGLNTGYSPVTSNIPDPNLQWTT